MARDTFQLDIAGAGRIILQGLARGVVEQSAQAIMARANNMGAALSANQPGFKVTTRVGVIRKGSRVIATVQANDASDAHGAYVAREALVKAKDAGRL